MLLRPAFWISFTQFTKPGFNGTTPCDTLYHTSPQNRYSSFVSLFALYYLNPFRSTCITLAFSTTVAFFRYLSISPPFPCFASVDVALLSLETRTTINNPTGQVESKSLEVSGFLVLETILYFLLFRSRYMFQLDVLLYYILFTFLYLYRYQITTHHHQV